MKNDHDALLENNLRITLIKKSSGHKKRRLSVFLKISLKLIMRS